MKRLIFLSLYAALSALAASQPNIIVIMTDDMGYSDLGCYGGEIQTPHLDALAAEGIRYTQMYNTSKCWTTRISLLSGIYHQRSDRDFAHTALPSQVLKPAGYHCWWSGKHHASFNPFDRGFDHFSGFLGGAINFWNPSDQARPGEPAPGWRASYTWAFDDKLIHPYVPEKSFYATDAFTDWALEWLDEPRPKNEPFFLFLAYNAPHWPLHAHPEDIAKYEGVYDVGYEAIRAARYKKQLALGLYDPETAPLSAAAHKAWDTLTTQQQKQEALRMQIHAAMVDRVDQNVGRLVNKLKANGSFENTLILFLVDNGASHETPGKKQKTTDAPWGSVGSFEAIGLNWANVANTPLRRWKISSMEGGINTPMIAHWPKGITAPAGSFSREACHLIDLMPTWMDLAGDQAEYPETTALPLDGISITPTFSGQSLERKAPLFFQYGSWQAVREGPWKLVRSTRSDWELYDLSRDRTETNDLADAHPERVANLTEKWSEWQATWKNADAEAPSAKRNKKKKKKSE